MRSERGIATAPILLLTGFGLFVIVIGFLVVSSMMPREAFVFEPTPIGPTPDPVQTLLHDTVTIDSQEPTTWHFFDFDRGSVMLPPDTAGWDLAIRRFTVIAADAVADMGPADAVADMGPAAFDEVTEAPAAGYVETSRW